MSLTNPHDPLITSLHKRTRQDPPAGSWRVHVGGRACGWTAPRVAAALEPGYMTDHSRLILQLPADNVRLAAIADFLHGAGLLAGWRSELLDIPTDGGEVLASIERAAMRTLGFTTRSVHLNAYTPSGKMWIARRALTKNVDPGLWDTLVGGLIASGETPGVALLRESDEEAGLTPSDLANCESTGSFVVSRQVPEGYQVEQVIISDCVLPADCQPANQDGEVMEIRQAGLSEVLDMLAADMFTAEAALSILQSTNTPARLALVG